MDLKFLYNPLIEYSIEGYIVLKEVFQKKRIAALDYKTEDKLLRVSHF